MQQSKLFSDSIFKGIILILLHMSLNLALFSQNTWILDGSGWFDNETSNLEPVIFSDGTLMIPNIVGLTKIDKSGEILEKHKVNWLRPSDFVFTFVNGHHLYQLDFTYGENLLSTYDLFGHLLSIDTIALISDDAYKLEHFSISPEFSILQEYNVTEYWITAFQAKLIDWNSLSVVDSVPGELLGYYEENLIVLDTVAGLVRFLDQTFNQLDSIFFDVDFDQKIFLNIHGEIVINRDNGRLLELFNLANGKKETLDLTIDTFLQQVEKDKISFQGQLENNTYFSIERNRIANSISLFCQKPREEPTLTSLTYFSGESNNNYKYVDDVFSYVENELGGLTLVINRHQVNLSTQNRTSYYSIIKTNAQCQLDDTRSIEGIVYQDLNENGIREVDEPGIANLRLYSPDNQLSTLTNDTGYFEIEIPDSSSLTYQRDICIDITDTFLVSSLDTNFLSIPISINYSLKDLILTTGSYTPRCGFTVFAWLIARNQSCGDWEGDVGLVISDLVELVSVDKDYQFVDDTLWFRDLHLA